MRLSESSTKKMIQKINISDLDKNSILSHDYPKDHTLNKVDFSGLVVNKPWGYEYLMFETPEVSIWMLYIKKGYSTSMHCHLNKKTVLIILSGEAICTTLNQGFNLYLSTTGFYEKFITAVTFYPAGGFSKYYLIMSASGTGYL